MTKHEAIEALEEVKMLDDSMFVYSQVYNDALDMAIEALKAQEPRVMTLEEVKQWCEMHPHKQNPVWVEFQHGYGNDGWRVGLINSGLLLLWCKDKEARLWTSRPTDEQREAIPWN